MRPVARGQAPRTYSTYGDAIDDLRDRLGAYCSYCERRLPVSLAVEHMSPKDIHPGRELDWDNFLLGCTNCNSTKGTADVADEETLWPDRDNTFSAYTYSEGGFVNIAQGLTGTQQSQAQTLVNLVGLKRHQARGWPRPTPRDKRWQQREEAWQIATQCKALYEQLGQSAQARELVLIAAQGHGFFSLWMTVFKSHKEVLVELLSAFPGTASDCFDSEGSTIPRPNGRI